MTKATTKKVNEAIRKISGRQDTELVKGNGYLYFWGYEEAGWGTTSVPVCHLHHLTLEQWVEAYQELYNQYEGK